MYWPDLLHKR